MEYIKITKVDGVTLHRRGHSFSGSLHLTTHHIIFTLSPPDGGGATAAASNGATAANGSTGTNTATGTTSTLPRELWCCYPMIEKGEFRKGSAIMYRSDYEEDSSTESIDYLGPETQGANLKLFCRDYNFLSFDFNDISECRAAFESIMRLTCIDRIDKCYAFLYEPIGIESPFNSWNDYDVIKEFEREGLHFKGNDSDSLGSFGWRITKLNADYNLCESYPSQICIPRTFSDTMLGHTVRSRSKRRFPALAYYYKKNGCTIVRSSQPLIGLKQNRSFQDEKLLYEVFRTNGREDKRNLIVDARPMTSALAQVALGGGTENMDNYWGDRNRKLFLGLENIHVMRESIGKIKDLLKNGDVEEGGDLEWPEKLSRSGWTGHISGLLRSTDLLVKWIHLQGVHIVIHCSDGWDRTPQVISLVQICIDPYFRTLEGFIVLVEKDWCSFGHRFNERCGHLQKEAKFYNYTSDSNFRKIRELNQAFKHQQSTKFESPVFQQFLDCVYQLIRQYPTSFEYNERFLRRLVYHLYSCQYGTFLEDCEKERVELRLSERTRSVWDYFKARRGQFTNEYYEGGRGSEANDGEDEDEDEDVLYPNFTDVIYWYQLYGKKYEEMNELKQPVEPEEPVEPKEPPNEAKIATEVVLERKLERLEIE